MKTLAFAATLAAALSAVPVFAQDGADRRIAIQHADLDLAAAAGQAALDLRLLHAARTACGTPSPANARGRARSDACVADVTAAAAPQRAALIALAQRQAAQPALASR
ncbi:UrcA family protein [Sphingosinicella sp. LHD-64]|uniref:UrcA family protein n=1 Tax=Sphingosinicella sp. LHD-64 TaxID=3072139 RepID=UPI00280FDA88|nr:UrcA family protein [Sphingosinicella sp. LHD-64]MDQ8755682.1 UrcA family protein [Sphingosinicella sp. LHD-64]